jgi:hypothetical protein
VTFTAIVVSHANPPGLARILGNLHYQTRRPDETLVFVSGLGRGEFCRMAELFPWAQFFLEDDMQDWGHAKRAAGIERATGEFIGFFNDDDSYALDYIEQMLATVEGADVAWCAWNENPDCAFVPGSSTAGNFIVSTDLAKQVGWKFRHYEADGVFIEGLVQAGAVCVKHDGPVLYHHNI